MINKARIRGNVQSSWYLSEEEWDKVFRTNLIGTLLVSIYVCVLMRGYKTSRWSRGFITVDCCPLDLCIYTCSKSQLHRAKFLKSEITQRLLQKRGSRKWPSVLYLWRCNRPRSGGSLSNSRFFSLCRWKYIHWRRCAHFIFSDKYQVIVQGMVVLALTSLVNFYLYEMFCLCIQREIFMSLRN